MSLHGRRRCKSDSTCQESVDNPLDKDHYRIVVLGAAGVGKTCIVSQFMYQTFHVKYKATLEELHRGEFQVRGKTLTLDVLDTSGSHEFPAMRKLCISTADAFILVYSVDDESTFDEVKSLRLDILHQRRAQQESGGVGEPFLPPIVIVGNKIDLGEHKRTVQKETAESTAYLDWDNGYVEVSAKDNSNIPGIFREILRQAHVSLDDKPSTTEEKRESKRPWSSFRGSRHKKLQKANSCVIA